MDDPVKLASEVFQHYGISGLVALAYCYDRFYLSKKEEKQEEEEKRRKKESGEWVDWKTVKDLDARLNTFLADNKVFMEKEAEENLVINSLAKDVEFQGKEIAETKADVQDIFKLMSEIKTLIIQQAQNK